MKPTLLLLPVLGLAGCAGQHPSPPPSAVTVPDEAAPETIDLREPSRVHTYLVNDYVDPNNPRLRHRGHLVDVVEQDEKWNLDDPTETNLGPVTAAPDPNAAPNPYNAEFETELAQQRDQYQRLVGLGGQMNAEMEKLQAMTGKEADAVSENAALRNRLDSIQAEVESLKTPPVALKLPTKPSFWSLNYWFSPRTPETPVQEPQLAFRTNVVLRPAEPSLPPPAIPAPVPSASTNAPDAVAVPPPGEMAAPQDQTPR
jgi:hypothetical protein